MQDWITTVPKTQMDFDNKKGGEEKMKTEKGSKKVLFVDIDGVLINGMQPTYDRAHPKHVAQLNRVIAATGAQIVLSSAWRVYGYTYMAEKFKEWGVKSPIIDITPDFGVQPRRGIEIQAWLDTHPYVTNFAIVDDNNWMGHLTRHLVLTDFDKGLTPERADDLIKMLKHGPSRN